MLVSDQRYSRGFALWCACDCFSVVVIEHQLMTFAVLIGHPPLLPMCPAPCLVVSLETFDPATGQTVNTSQLLTRAQFDLLLSQAINVSTLVTQAQFDAQTADQRDEDFLTTNQVTNCVPAPFVAQQQKHKSQRQQHVWQRQQRLLRARVQVLARPTRFLCPP